MKTKPLTPKEKIWIDSAQQLFSKCPKRFDFLTIGDADLTIVDNTFIDDIELHDGGANRAGIVLDRINTTNRVHGVSG